MHYFLYILCVFTSDWELEPLKTVIIGNELVGQGTHHQALRPEFSAEIHMLDGQKQFPQVVL